MASLIQKLIYPFKSGKNAKWLYFTKALLAECIPDGFYRARRDKIIQAGLSEFDKDDVMRRVDYYNKLTDGATLSADAKRLSETRIGKKSHTYFFDTRAITRYFDASYRWRHLPGDITHVPEEPTIVKSRPIGEMNANSVVLNLNKIRHFIFIQEDIPFAEKQSMAVFRGKVRNKDKRIRFFKKHFGNPHCDLGDTSGHSNDPEEWKTGKMTIRDQLNFKFILAIEGNDVASNLKWVMSSNSIAFMPKPEYETWFMEGMLQAGVHYVELREDYSDLDEKIQYYAEHVEEAQKIIDTAHAYVAQFQNAKKEKLISLLVMQKYFARCACNDNY